VTLQARRGSETNVAVANSKDDMLAILFPHLYEEIEFLVPPDGLEDVPIENCDLGVGQESGDIDSRQPLAGPSRLR